MSWTVGKKISSIVAGAGIGFVLVGGVGVYASGAVRDAVAKSGAIAEAAREHQDVDMSHDALRADAYQAVLGETAEAMAGFNEHKVAMVEEFTDGSAASKISHIRPAWEEAKPVVERYITSVEEVIVASKNGVGATEKPLTDMDKAFDELADRLGSITDQLHTERDVAEKKVHDTLELQRNLTIVLPILVLICMALASRAIAYRITKPLKEVVVTFERLAQGDLTAGASSAAAGQRDEIGQLARSAESAIENLRTTVGGIHEQVAGLAAAAEELSAVSTQLGAGAEESSSQATSVAAGAEQVDHSVQSVAAAVEEFSASIREIDAACRQASAAATESAESAGDAQSTVSSLSVSTSEVGNIARTIGNIAEQTKLLALNATIEAARAGEAGKGFAVVASEVKDLARETANASEEIERSLLRIAADASGAVEVIGHIVEAVNENRARFERITGAVGEQNAAAEEIARNTAEAAQTAGCIA